MNHRRLSVALLVLSTVAAMHSLSAQVTETGSTTVSPITTDAFLLTPAAPSATRTVMVDAAEKMIVKVSALSQQVTVTLISPNLEVARFRRRKHQYRHFESQDRNLNWLVGHREH